MFHEQAQIGLKGRQRSHRIECRSSNGAKAGDPLFLFRDDIFVRPTTLRQCERIVDPP